MHACMQKKCFSQIGPPESIPKPYHDSGTVCVCVLLLWFLGNLGQADARINPFLLMHVVPAAFSPSSLRALRFLQAYKTPTRTHPKHSPALNPPHKPCSPSTQEVAEFGKPGDLTMVAALLIAGCGSAPPPEVKAPQRSWFTPRPQKLITYIVRL